MVPESKEIGLDEYRRVVRVAKDKHVYATNDFPFSRVLKGLGATTYEIIEERLQTGKRTLPCTAGERMLVISETGQVKPCEILGKDFGNLRDFEFDLKMLLDEPGAQGICSHIKEKKCSCTFENAILNSAITYPRIWPKLVKNIVQENL